MGYIAKRLIILTFCTLGVLSHGVICAQDRALLAEGDYIALTKSGSKPLSYWKLWHLNSAEFEVIDSGVRNASAIQTFRFDSQFVPSGFSIKAGDWASPDSGLARALPRYEISCAYKVKELTCETRSGDGPKSTKTVLAVSPYVVVGEFYDLDFAWFLTGVVHAASSGKTRNGLVNVYAITDGKTGGIGLEPDKPIQVISNGDGEAMALGQMQTIRKYKWDSMNMAATPQGLVVRLGMAPDPELGFAIDNYKEYEPWGVPFGSIANVAASTPSDTASKTAVRVQVAAGVMIGSLVHRVQPAYPTTAKLDKIQGKVLLRAVINTEGEVTEVDPISGPSELIVAAVEAVKQWQYRPYRSQGQPVEVETTIQINFLLADRDRKP